MKIKEAKMSKGTLAFIIALSMTAIPAMAGAPDKLESFVKPMTADSSTTGSQMKSLTTDVDAVFKNHGYAAAACRTVCSTTVTIGPDGRPVPSVSCQLVCEM
jgi:hypothetical protein